MFETTKQLFIIGNYWDDVNLHAELMKPQLLFTNGGKAARNEPRGPLQGREASAYKWEIT